MFLFSGLKASSGFSYVVPRTVFAPFVSICFFLRSVVEYVIKGPGIVKSLLGPSFLSSLFWRRPSGFVLIGVVREIFLFGWSNFKYI